MPIVSMTIEEDNQQLDEYIDKVHVNLSTYDMVRNPFSGGITKKEGIIILDMVPIYPNLSLVSLVSCGIIVFFTGIKFTWWLLIPAFFMITGIPYTRWFIAMMFRKGARKSGYKGRLRIISNSEALRRLFICPNTK